MEQREAMGAGQVVKEGAAFLQSGAHEQALAAFTRAESLYEVAEDCRGQARTSVNKALVLVQLQRFAEALAGFKKRSNALPRGTSPSMSPSSGAISVPSTGTWGNRMRRSKATRMRSSSIANSVFPNGQRTSARTSLTPESCGRITRRPSSGITRRFLCTRKPKANRSSA